MTVFHMLSRVCVYVHDNVHACVCACVSATYPQGFSSLSPGDMGRDADIVVSVLALVHLPT